ncbi:hypothetical protein [Govanella unica]|uniref:Uncharacterized protein n=1 Tax=Govanella unica TaxID=2975056 RepID=A0A9X3TW62_9PROT|nr:hypothetical protein [Govania unica]MDA5192669.1 hypothetical protein [Govania unica]
MSNSPRAKRKKQDPEEILKRASDDIQSLLSAAGLGDPGDDEHAQIFRQLAEQEEAAQRELLAGLASAANNLYRKLYRVVAPDRANPREDIIGACSQGTATDLAKVRSWVEAVAMLRGRLQAKEQGGQKKTQIDFLLRQLADIWLTHTDSTSSPWSLGTDATSPFIVFASMALERAFHASEITETALGQRWRRLKKAETYVD